VSPLQKPPIYREDAKGAKKNERNLKRFFNFLNFLLKIFVDFAPPWRRPPHLRRTAFGAVQVGQVSR